MPMIKNAFFIVLILCVACSPALPQARPYPGADLPQLYQHYLDVVNNIPAFDHHAHPGFADDPDVDAMAAPPGSAALRERDTNPELVAAARGLWGYPYADFSPEHSKWLVQKKAEVKKQYPGTAYFNMLLDKMNFDRGVANRAMMPAYLDAKRFPWVFFADAFMWPFDNTQQTARNAAAGKDAEALDATRKSSSSRHLWGLSKVHQPDARRQSKKQRRHRDEV
jgi:hypothetical protein